LQKKKINTGNTNTISKSCNLKLEACVVERIIRSRGLASGKKSLILGNMTMVVMATMETHYYLGSN
jgi:hypothetical protein